MTYKLALELKNAGFPKLQGFDFDNWEWGGEMIKDYCPTLSELIEACGDGFWSLIQKDVGNMATEKWLAIGLDHRELRGYTPEEAVAKLWLKLKQTPKE